jgi:hypothetical protein
MRLVGNTSSTAPIRPGGPSETTRGRARRPRATIPSRNAFQASVDSQALVSRPTSTGSPSVTMPHAASTGSARATSCVGKCDPSKEQVPECQLGEVAGLPGVELVPDRLAGPAEGRFRQGGLRAEGVGQAGLHAADRQAADEPGDHQRPHRVGPAHPDTEQPGGERFVSAAQLRAVDHHRPGGGLDRGRAVPIAATLAGPAPRGCSAPGPRTR